MSEPDISVTEQLAVMIRAELTLLVQRLVAANGERREAAAARDERIGVKVAHSLACEVNPTAAARSTSRHRWRNWLGLVPELALLLLGLP